MLKEISPERSLEGLMLKLKLQYFGHLMRRTDSQEKTPRSGEGGDRGCDDWQPWPKEHEQSLGDGDGEAWCAAAHAVRCEELDTTERLDKNTAVGRFTVCAGVSLRTATALPRISGPCLGLSASRRRALL